MSKLTSPVLWFYLAIALLLGHELDAVARNEWRMLPGLNLLPDTLGRDVFILLHVPFFLLLLWLVTKAQLAVRRTIELIICGLLILHAIVHFWLTDHVLNEFEAPLEQLFVYGAAMAASCHLIIAKKSWK